MIKKALTISISHVLFSIEEDAYERLNSYFVSVREHFKNTPERDEIISDIENRIAEQLKESKEQVIGISTVEKILVQMGMAEDFGDDDTSRSSSDAVEGRDNGAGQKRLYRNPHEKAVAGVCAGIAAYFGIEVQWVRLAFLIAVTFNGIGILIYLILWAALPEAKTGSQKLQMIGSPVNLETISETVRDRGTESPVNRSLLYRIVSTPFEWLAKVVRFVVRYAGPVIRVGVGAFLTIAPMLVLAALLVASGLLFTKGLWIASDISMHAILPGPIYVLAVIGFTFATTIPFVFILMAGISLLQRKNIISGVVVSSLLGAWFIGLIFSGLSAVHAVGNYYEFIKTSPAYEEVSQDIPIGGTFTEVSLSRGVNVLFAKGTSTSLVAKGRAKDMSRIAATIENGVLSINSVPAPEKMWCLFCEGNIPQLTVSLPTLSKVTAEGGVSIHSEAFPQTETLTLDFADGVYADLVLVLKKLSFHGRNGALLQVKGSAESADISLDHGSRLKGYDFGITDAVIDAMNGSRAELNVTKSLTAQVSHGSSVVYDGKPDVASTTSHGGEIRTIMDSEW